MAVCKSPLAMYCWPSSVWMRAASSASWLLLVCGSLPPPSPLVSVLVVTHPASASAMAAPNQRSRRMHGSLSLIKAFAELGLPARAVEHLALQLAAGGIDVVAARATQHGEHVGVEQQGLERADGVGVRALETRTREGIERDQVDLRAAGGQ